MKGIRLLVAVCAGFAGFANAAVVIIPQSALNPSTTLYTTDIGITIGSPLLMTGGGNAANVGASRNDDGFSGPINFGFNFSLFGATYTSFFANNNGNITFTSGLAGYTPTGLQGATQPIISPFFADVDTRNAASGVMSLQTHSSAAGNEVIITWPNVGYYSAQGSPLNTFQLVVRADDYLVPVGEGQVGFFWTTMGWEVGSASGGGPGGLCAGLGGINQPCTPAAVGFGDGLANGYVLEGSTQNGIAGVVNNERLWVSLVGGVPQVPRQVPEPGVLWLLSFGAVALVLSQKRKTTV